MASVPEHRILITGGTGFVARFLVSYLQAEYPRCRLFVPGLDALAMVDVCDRAAVRQLVRDVAPTAVVHLAAIAAPAEARGAPDRAWEVNLTGTRHLAEEVLAHAPAARFVYAGSSDAYGASFIDAAGPLNEDAPLRPMNVYAVTKAAADLLIGQMAHDGLRAVRFRPFNHTGPEQTDAYVIPAFARQIAEIAAGRRDPVVRVGNLAVERDFLDVRDVVRAYAMAALVDLPDTPGLVFNLASGTPTSLREVLDTLIALAGVAVEVQADRARIRPTDVVRTWGDCSRARARLGWQPVIPLAQTLDDVLTYWRARP
ncbi:MAG: GDP-mannose 4,6-dehydratase [Xanthobacteraceae bacterium]